MRREKPTSFEEAIRNHNGMFLGSPLQYVGKRPVYSVARFPKGFEKGKWRFFCRPRAGHPHETNLDFPSVPVGEFWGITGITLAPDTPYSFRAFVDLCESFPEAQVEIAVVNRVAEVKIPLTDFWIPGEYILNSFHNIRDYPVLIPELVVFDAWIRFPERATEPQIATVLKDAAFRMILHIEWAARK